MLSLAQTAQSESLSITRDRDADAEGALVGRNSGSTPQCVFLVRVRVIGLEKRVRMVGKS